MDSDERGVGPVIDAFITYLRANEGLSEHTCRSYHSDVEQCMDVLGIRTQAQLEAVQLDDLRAWMANELQQVSKTSLARKTIAVRRLFAWCFAHGVTHHDPAAALKTPKLGKTLPADRIEYPPDKLPVFIIGNFGFIHPKGLYRYGFRRCGHRPGDILIVISDIQATGRNQHHPIRLRFKPFFCFTCSCQLSPSVIR